ncbi:MAG: Asp-tRNA(Asn)/Glu-tRNA(Gln) amidotransferase subunit GatB [Chloroflexi bacterium]|nr:Asp-tRNA(Asn)/Glu-tRNA(Gln) amidotransferase subunit GatB [Chloroflexota bacterium]MDA8188744.1 Asp-tRNA(Asn)/Glu-tRNA(Gln) amidotransferase subunit GatB [Dehalococcoidales bacterium]
MLSKYEAVIGLEVHAQLLTKSKMFCRCNAQYADAPPNSVVCPVDLGLPGALPVINRTAVEYTVMTALALNCSIPEFSRFDRKNYFYPDLPKNYQISQYDLPLSHDGYMVVQVGDEARRIGIIRVHLEEDTAKLMHRTDARGKAYSLVDFNRAGTPLMEIVSKPDIRSPEEARLYLMKLRNILRWIGVSTGNMEEGSFRCDANVSIRPVGSKEFGTKVEVKNMNSFRAVYRALEYEMARQADVLDSGGRIAQETRGWVEDRGVTVSQRSKEYAHDYRYFPEPDLPPLVLTRDWVQSIREKLPELPDARRERFASQYGLSQYEATLLTNSKSIADFFEATVGLRASAKAVANWMVGELFRLLNAANIEIEQSKVSPEHLTEMLKLIDQGTISASMAKTVLEEVFASGKKPGDIVQERGLAQISGVEELQAIVHQVLATNPQAIADYKAGKANAFGFLVGQVMKATRGKANPGVVNQLLREKLDKQ